MEDSPWGEPASPPAKASAPSSISTVKTPGGRSKPSRRFTSQPTKLEALDDGLGPLGPLGANAPIPTEADEPPALPQKEHTPSRSARPQPSASRTTGGRDDDEDDDYRPSTGARIPPPVEPPSNDGPRRQTQPSMSVEQAAKPTFNISVGDPHKVGDLTSSHTVYQVRTTTTSKAYRVPEFAVSRRYRDFLWLYNQLHSNNPGVVVPPPPDKQTVGRFDSGFVESRRAALERMLNKTAAHHILQHDADLKIFLESEAFNVDVKHRERKDSDLPESKGMFSGLSLSVGSGGKFVEHDDWFLDRRIYLETLETQLKALLKSTDTAIIQRKALAESCLDLSTSLNTLSQVELSPTLTGPLASLSDLHLRIRDLYDRQAQQDVLTLGVVIEEYIRLISSIKKAFEQRQKSWHNWHNAESDLAKRRSALDKTMRQGRSQQDRLNTLQADVADAERRAHQTRLAFEDLGRGMRAELERFESEKVEDFRMGVETFLESSVEAQKELIELWETYLMQLDAEEEDAAAVTATAPATDASGAGTQNRMIPQHDGASDPTSTSKGQSGDATSSNADAPHEDATPAVDAVVE